MTPQQLKAMKLALEALELLTDTEQTFGALDYGDNAITALEEALAEHAMSEVQRLGQEIEQEPVAWATKEDFHRELERRLKHIREEMKIKSVTMRCKDYDIALPIIDTDFGRVLVGQVSTPPQRKPLTEEQRKDLMNKAWDKWLGGEDDNHLFAWHFSFEVEAAHGIKE